MGIRVWMYFLLSDFCWEFARKWLRIIKKWFKFFYKHVKQIYGQHIWVKHWNIISNSRTLVNWLDIPQSCGQVANYSECEWHLKRWVYTCGFSYAISFKCSSRRNRICKDCAHRMDTKRTATLSTKRLAAVVRCLVVFQFFHLARCTRQRSEKYEINMVSVCVGV